MKKFIPYLLFSAATLHIFLGISPVMALGCSSQSDKAEVICEDDITECQDQFSISTTN